MNRNETDQGWMRRALQLAREGKGYVEPNPMVGCVAVRDDVLIASGFHRRFGGPHAEVEALANCSATDLKGATVYVTLEPCSHYGKTPPCANFLIERKPARVVVAMEDPFPEVSGRGIRKLREAGIQVDVGLLQEEAIELNAPYLKQMKTKRPWVIAKWGMSIDGAIATHTGDSKWITSESSRAVVHRIRSEVDAIVTGIGTVLADDPMLNARTPSGYPTPRTAMRVVLDRQLRIPLDSQLVRSASEIPLILFTSAEGSVERIDRLRGDGVRVELLPAKGEIGSYEFALDWLGANRCTNVLLECGATLLGEAFDLGEVDQIECFIAPKILGGSALRPVLGQGISKLIHASAWETRGVETLDGDVHISLFRSASI